MSYSLYNNVKNAKFDNSIILTYSLNIKLYESIIWMRLHKNGCFNNLLFVDGNQYNNALLQEKSTIDYLGTGYAIYPIYSLAAFHPKIILLTSRDKGKLIIGSANITSSALTFNRELINEFDFEIDKNETYLYLFKDCWDYINKVSMDAPPFISRQVHQIYHTTPWLEKKCELQKNVSFVSYPATSNNENVSTPDFIESKIGKARIKNLNILSPFFDKDLRLINYFDKKYDIKNINIIIDPETSFDIASHNLIEKRVSLYKFVNPIEKTGHNKLHAKVIYFQTDKDDVLLCGSMNFTSRALGLSLGTNNHEAGILYSIKDKNYFNELGLSEMINDANKISIKDIKFEKKVDQTKQEAGALLIKWVESFYDKMEIYLYSEVSEGINKVSIRFYSKTDNLLEEITVKRFTAEGKVIFIQGISKDLIDKGVFVEAELVLKSGKRVLTQKSIINKIEKLNETTTKSEVVKAVRVLNTVVPSDQNYGVLLDLLRNCLFDAYNYDLVKIPKKPIEDKDDGSVKGLSETSSILTYKDVISVVASKKGTAALGKHYDYAGNIIKEYFINTFIKGGKIKEEFYTDKINAEFDSDKKVSEKLKEMEKEYDIDDEDSGPQEQIADYSENDPLISYPRDRELESKLLRRLIKRYIEHVNVLENNLGLVNLENEFVRHFAVFWMVLKGLDRKYSIISNSRFSLSEFIWFNLFFSTSLLNKNIGIILNKYIEEKSYLHDEGFGFGVCSLLTGFCLTDMQLHDSISERFMAYDKRKQDLLWITNRILLLSFVSRFNENDINSILEIVNKHYNTMKKYVGNILDKLDFITIKDKVKRAKNIANSLNFSNDIWESKKNKVAKEIKKGDLVFIKPYGLYLIKEDKTENIETFGGANSDGTFYSVTISSKQHTIIGLNMNDEVKHYFKGLLDPRNSYWYANVVDDSIY